MAALAVALLLLTAPVGKPRADPVAATAVVLEVVDGDTIDVRGRLRPLLLLDAADVIDG